MAAEDAADDWPVHEFQVKAKDIRWAGDSLEEWGYYPASVQTATLQRRAPAAQPVTPASARELAEAGTPERIISKGEMPGSGTQAPPRQTSTLAMPEDLTALAKSPSSQLGIPKGQSEVVIVPPRLNAQNKAILHESNDLDVVLTGVREVQPRFDEALERLYPEGFIQSRLKSEARIQDKLEVGRTPEDISDFLGARVVADDFDAAFANLADDFEVLQDDFVRRGEGYEGRHVQVRIPGTGVSAELQFITTRTAAVQETTHQFYEIARKLDITEIEFLNANAAQYHLFTNTPQFTMAEAVRFNKNAVTPPPGMEDTYQQALDLALGRSPEQSSEIIAKIREEFPDFGKDRLSPGKRPEPQQTVEAAFDEAAAPSRAPPPRKPPGPPPESLGDVPPLTPPSGRPRTLVDLNREAKGQRALTPEQRADLNDYIRPLDPIRYEMGSFTSHAQRLLLPDTPIMKSLRSVPGLRQVIGGVSPAQLARDNPVQMIGVQKGIFESIETARARHWALAWWDDAQDILGFTEVRGVWRGQKVAAAAGKPLNPKTARTIDDFIDHPERYDFTPEQAAVIKEGSDTQTASLRANQRVGVDVVELGSNYWHRIVKKVPNAKDSGTARVQLGSRKGYTHRRAFADMDDVKGYEYETNPLIRVQARLEAGIRTFSDQSARIRIKNLPGVERPLERVERFAPEAIEAQKAARVARDEAKARFLDDPTPENELSDTISLQNRPPSSKRVLIPRRHRCGPTSALAWT